MLDQFDRLALCAINCCSEGHGHCLYLLHLSTARLLQIQRLSSSVWAEGVRALDRKVVPPIASPARVAGDEEAFLNLGLNGRLDGLMVLPKNCVENFLLGEGWGVCGLRARVRGRRAGGVMGWSHGKC